MEAMMLVWMAGMILEALLQVAKGWVPEDRTLPGWTWQVLGAALGVALCLLGEVDLLAEAGLYLRVGWVGQALTGVLISRGASFVHDLWGRMKDGGVFPEAVEMAENEEE